MSGALYLVFTAPAETSNLNLRMPEAEQGPVSNTSWIGRARIRSNSRFGFTLSSGLRTRTCNGIAVHSQCILPARCLSVFGCAYAMARLWVQVEYVRVQVHNDVVRNRLHPVDELHVAHVA